MDIYATFRYLLFSMYVYIDIYMHARVYVYMFNRTSKQSVKALLFLHPPPWCCFVHKIWIHARRIVIDILLGLSIYMKEYFIFFTFLNICNLNSCKPAERYATD